MPLPVLAIGEPRGEPEAVFSGFLHWSVMKNNAVLTASLADYAAVINDEHRLAYGCAAETIGHVRIAGEHLLKVKAALKHGEWLPWLVEHVDVSDRQARTYMTVAANWKQIAAKLEVTSDLTIEGALKAVAKPKPKEPAERSKLEVTSDLPTDPPAALEAPPDLPKPAKPIKPAEVEKLQSENQELSSQLVEMATQQQTMLDELTFLQKIETEGDKLAAALAEVKKLQALVRVLEERVRGLMNEKLEAVRAAKMWQRRAQKVAA